MWRAGLALTWLPIVGGVMYTALSWSLSKVLSGLRWNYINFVRIVLGDAKVATLDDIGILYRSKHFLVVNKRQDVKINSNDPTDLVTVETQLRHRFPEYVDEKTVHGFRFVHRLDYSTSGALCIALTKRGSQWGAKAFCKRYVTKHYLALVRGHVDPTKCPWDIDIGIGKDMSITEINKMCTEDKATCSSARESRTSMVLLQHGTYSGQPASKVLLVPLTGRTHQLRVHCMHIGHLIVGDYTYSNRSDVRPYRMMLHSYHLVIPMKREHIDVTARDPFTADRDPLWKPQKIFRSYEESVKEYSLERDYPNLKEGGIS